MGIDNLAANLIDQAGSSSTLSSPLPNIYFREEALDSGDSDDDEQVQIGGHFGRSPLNRPNCWHTVVDHLILMRSFCSR